jgi:hypothetical protein
MQQLFEEEGKVRCESHGPVGEYEAVDTKKAL